MLCNILRAQEDVKMRNLFQTKKHFFERKEFFQDWVACVFGIHVTCYSILGELQRKLEKRGRVVYLEWKESVAGEQVRV